MSTQHTFKVGDKVKLKKTAMRNSGDTAGHRPHPFKFATVIDVEPSTYTGPLTIRVQADCPEGSTRTAWLHHTSIKHRKTFKVGDKVEIAGPALSGSVTFPIGTIGTVVHGPDEDGDYRVTALDDYWFYKASSLKRVKDKVQPLGKYTYWLRDSSQTISAWSKEERTGALSRRESGTPTVEHKSPITGAGVRPRNYAEDEVIDNGDGTGTVRTLKQLAKFRAKQAK